MKKNILSVLAMIFTILFLILTGTFMVLVKNNAGSKVLSKCITVYVFFVVLYLIYIAFTAVFNSIRIKGYYSKKKIVTFIITLVIFSIIFFLINYFMNIGFTWYKNLLTALVVSVVFFYSEAIFYFDKIEK